jgi:hypothetical protein
LLLFTKREVWLISAPGAQQTAGRAVSLLGAKAPAGSHLSRCFLQESGTFRSNQLLYHRVYFPKTYKKTTIC